MSKLYYQKKFRSELSDVQERRINEAIEARANNPRLTQITVNGETLFLKDIEIMRNDPDGYDQDNKEFEQKRRQAEMEMERMRKWSVEQKVYFNITRNFGVKYLLQVGYLKYLGEGWDKGPEAWWKQFIDKYRAENPENYIMLENILTKFFQENPERYWCGKSMFEEFLPAFSREKANNII